MKNRIRSRILLVAALVGAAFFMPALLCGCDEDEPGTAAGQSPTIYTPYTDGLAARRAAIEQVQARQ